MPHEPPVEADEWTLKQVQGDGWEKLAECANLLRLTGNDRPHHHHRRNGQS
jgi:hypothetical protein